MKKFVLVLGILLISAVLSSTAYAGTLNGYENEIIAAANKTYEDKGIQYRVDPSYLDSLKKYLSSDAIDLTAEQRDEVLQIAFSSIETGIQDGYLIPVVGKTASDSNSDGSTLDNENTGIDNINEGTNNNVKDSTDDITSDNSGSNQNSATGNQPLGQEETITTGEDSIAADGATTDHTTSTTDEMISEILKGNVAASSIEGATISNESSTDNPVIKNTGFDLTITLIMIVGMGMLMLTGMFVTMKFNYFAHNHE